MTPPRTKKEYLKQIVSEKNRWFRPLSDDEKKLGFLGWHERGYLPHCDFPGLVQFVTFRLADSMPASRRVEWEKLLEIEDIRIRRTKLEEYLDRGIGSCCLRDKQCAQWAVDSLLYFHDDRYELLAWCIMPNHVHVLLHVRQTPLSKIVQGWKINVTGRLRQLRVGELEVSAKLHGKLLNAPRRSSALQSLWQREYWDTFMRNEEQEQKAIKYIEANPVKAKLCRAPDNWAFSSACFRDKFGRLSLPEEMVYGP